MKITTELALGIIIIGILATFLNPTHLLMPDSINTMLVLGLILGFLSFVGLVWQEQANDERETVHIHKSGRISFLVGASITAVGIVVQATQHNVDPWLLYALSGMVLTKLVSRIFHHFRN